MKKSKIIILLTTFAVLSTILFTTCKKEEPELFGSINGIVTISGTTDALQGVTIVLTPTGKTLTTGSDGKFEYKDLEAKEYTLSATKDSYLSNTKTITVTVGEDTKADIILTADILTPTISTANPVVTSSNKATIDGIISDLGNGSIIAHGHVWSASPAPTISLTTKVDYGIKEETGVFTSTLSDLEPNTEYYVRAYATNTDGTAYSNEVTFTTPDEAATATLSTQSATNVAMTTATLNGIVNANDIEATITFEYGLTIEYGDAINATPSTVSGNTNTNVSADIAGLMGGQTYHFRVKADNTGGTSYGNDLNFTTPVAFLPEVTTVPPSNTSYYSTESGGIVTNDNGFAISARGVCWSLSPNPTIANDNTIDGTGTGSFSSSISNLTAGITYYVRAFATNSEGTGYGNQETFTTLSTTGATVTTDNISNVSYFTAVCGGNVTADGGQTITARGVCYNSSSNPTISNFTTSDGTGTGAFTSNLSDLTDNTTYYVKAYATNSNGTTYGTEKTFTTLNASGPSVTTVNVSNVSYFTATCGGNTTAENGTPVTARGVCYGTSPNPTTSNFTTSNGSGLGSFTNSLTGLTDNTTYYVRAYATNTTGTAYGTEQIFTTLDATEPTVTTDALSFVGTESATCGGNVTNGGTHALTAKGLCWSTSPNPTIADFRTNDGTGTGTFTSSLTDLSENTTYYVKAYATNSINTSYGSEKTFTTLTPVAQIGDFYAGGVVFYIDETGQNGLVCAVNDQSAGAEWGCYLTEISGADGTAIGTGSQNTIDIEAGCSTAGNAADLCAILTLNTYNDWFLPSKDELNSMYQNKDVINTVAVSNGGSAFADGSYWSSTEYNNTDAWKHNFSFGSSADVDKNNTYRVRAVRAF